MAGINPKILTKVGVRNGFTAAVFGSLPIGFKCFKGQEKGFITEFKMDN